jgi:hypothetical protein
MTLHPIPLNILILEENFLFFFISVCVKSTCIRQNTKLQGNCKQLDKTDQFTSKTVGKSSELVQNSTCKGSAHR